MQETSGSKARGIQRSRGIMLRPLLIFAGIILFISAFFTAKAVLPQKCPSWKCELVETERMKTDCADHDDAIKEVGTIMSRNKGKKYLRMEMEGEDRFAPVREKKTGAVLRMEKRRCITSVKVVFLTDGKDPTLAGAR